MTTDETNAGWLNRINEKNTTAAAATETEHSALLAGMPSKDSLLSKEFRQEGSNIISRAQIAFFEAVAAENEASERPGNLNANTLHTKTEEAESRLRTVYKSYAITEHADADIDFIIRKGKKIGAERAKFSPRIVTPDVVVSDTMNTSGIKKTKILIDR